MRNATLLSVPRTILNSNAAKAENIASPTLLLMLGLLHFGVVAPCMAQAPVATTDKITIEPDPVPEDLNLNDLFGTPSEESVRWLGTFLTKNPNWSLNINDNTIELRNFRSTVRGQVELPRLAAMIDSITAVVDEKPVDIKIEPKPESWTLIWDASKVEKEDDFELGITIRCSDRPVGIEQVAPIAARGDGLIRLPAHFAKTDGGTIRYEPQPHKNTIGWWSDKKDSVGWEFKVAQPGRYSVSVLTGCGAGQGGSDIELRLGSTPSPQTVETLPWKTVDTGHFQNFQWNRIGDFTIKSAGTYRLTVRAKTIAKQAVMDIRQIDVVLQAK